MAKIRTIAGCLVVTSVVMGGALVASVARGQDKPKETPDQKAIMEAWQKAMTPGKEHEGLAKKAGNWKLEMVDYSAGGVKSEATAEIKMIMGGRYQENSVKGNMMGQPFEGRSTTGYDNVRKLYVSSWIDNMGTGISTSEGKATDDKTVELKGKMMDPGTGSTMDIRSVEKTIDDDHFTFEMYSTTNGKEQKALSISYERVK